MTSGSAPAPAEDKKKGLSKVVSRWKTVLKRSDGSKRFSMTPRTPATAGPSAPKSDAPAPKPAAAPAPAEEKPVPATEPKTPVPETPRPTKVSRAEINAERARKLGERFQLNIEPHEWATLAGEKDAWRIEKPIRMRIHRTCHKCNTTFGANKVCGNCEHPRCTKCPRYPLKKKEKGKTAVAGVAGAIEVDTVWSPHEKIALTKPSLKAGGQPLVRKKPMQRVRRTCCECSTLYLSGNKICSSCAHTRCADCPRDPAKKKKYPDGYPGDRPSATTKKYACHKCDRTFPAAAEGTADPPPECTRCKHVKCDMCLTALPRKVVPEPDPEVLKRVEEKLRGLSLRGAGGVSTGVGS
ncbi:Zinc finger RING FYVE PHD-type protein [Rutstroemia sp. NJR-2017a BVV2]|nr:Zinc finger RING FYVE PHD-type protein [Rutstroemia sp. NJR-2017a BVV2]